MGRISGTIEGPALIRILRKSDSQTWIKNQKTSKLRFLRLLEKIRKMMQ